MECFQQLFLVHYGRNLLRIINGSVARQSTWLWSEEEINTKRRYGLLSNPNAYSTRLSGTCFFLSLMKGVVSARPFSNSQLSAKRRRTVLLTRDVIKPQILLDLMQTCCVVLFHLPNHQLLRKVVLWSDESPFELRRFRVVCRRKTEKYHPKIELQGYSQA